MDDPEVYLQPPASNRNDNVSGSPPPRTYYISSLSNLPLASFLETTFTANMNAINVPSDYGLTSDEIAQLAVYSSDSAQALWYTRDLSQLMGNLADCMTDSLRNQYADPDRLRSVDGTVYVLQPCVHVSWPWLILPVALVLLSCGLLLVSIALEPRVKGSALEEWQSGCVVPWPARHRPSLYCAYGQ